MKYDKPSIVEVGLAAEIVRSTKTTGKDPGQFADGAGAKKTTSSGAYEADE
jgi:hypothetical protein